MNSMSRFSKFSNSPNANKKLVEAYIKSTLLNIAVDFILDDSSKQKTITITKKFKEAVEHLLDSDPEIDLKPLVDESLQSLAEILPQNEVENVACHLFCRTVGRTKEECNRECGTEFIIPLK